MSLLAKLLLGNPGVENRRTCRLVGKWRTCRLVGKWSYALLQRKKKDVAPGKLKGKNQQANQDSSGEKKNCSKSEQEKTSGRCQC